ncbi:MAG: hypothetical protein ACR2JQ_05540 [Mycobacteriales bacterium]
MTAVAAVRTATIAAPGAWTDQGPLAAPAPVESDVLARPAPPSLAADVRASLLLFALATLVLAGVPLLAVLLERL